MSGPIREIVSEWFMQATAKGKKGAKKEAALEDALMILVGRGFNGTSITEIMRKAERWISEELTKMGVCSSVDVAAKEYSFGEEVITVEVNCDGVKKEVYLELDIRAEIASFS
jgi:hypothetical protein